MAPRAEVTTVTGGEEGGRGDVGKAAECAEGIGDCRGRGRQDDAASARRHGRGKSTLRVSGLDTAVGLEGSSQHEEL